MTPSRWLNQPFPFWHMTIRGRRFPFGIRLSVDDIASMVRMMVHLPSLHNGILTTCTGRGGQSPIYPCRGCQGYIFALAPEVTCLWRLFLYTTWRRLYHIAFLLSLVGYGNPVIYFQGNKWHTPPRADLKRWPFGLPPVIIEFSQNWVEWVAPGRAIVIFTFGITGSSNVYLLLLNQLDYQRFPRLLNWLEGIRRRGKRIIWYNKPLQKTSLRFYRLLTSLQRI